MVNYNGLTSKFNKNARAIVEELFDYLQTTSWGREIWCGRGWDSPSSSKEHGTGRAVDVMFTYGYKAPTPKQREAGEKLVDLLLANGKALGIQWIIFSKDNIGTWSYNFDRGSWKYLGKRGSVSANHRDHVHIYFKPSARLPKGFSFGSGKGSGAKPSGGAGSAAKPNTSLKRRISAKLAADVANRDLKASSGSTTNWGLVSDIQRALNARYPNLNIKVTGKWDKQTRDGYAAHQRSLGYTGKDADGLPGFSSLKILGDSTKVFSPEK